MYVLAASAGSTIGVVLLDFVCRRIGEEGLTRVLPQKRLQYLMKRVRQQAWDRALYCVRGAPSISFYCCGRSGERIAASPGALFGIVFVARTLRFALVGLAALRFGSGILRITQSMGFQWFMVGFAVFCFIESAVSVTRWLRHIKPVGTEGHRQS